MGTNPETAIKLAMHYFKLKIHPSGSLVIGSSTSSYNDRPNALLYSVAKVGYSV
jgi:hypothetical protein